MPTPNHLIAGLPAWATDEEASLAAAYVQGDDDTAVRAAAAKNIHGHQMAARYYWWSAYLAMQNRQFSAMRTMAGQADGAENASDPLLRAIFGERPVEERAAREGATVPEDVAAKCRKSVLAEMSRHRAAKRPTRTSAARMAKTAKSDSRKAVQEHVRKAGTIPMADLESWAAAAGLPAMIVRTMIRDGEIFRLRGDNITMEA